MKSEYATWAAERERVAGRLSVSERVARWFERPTPAEPCPFAWHAVSDLIPIEGDTNV